MTNRKMKATLDKIMEGAGLSAEFEQAVRDGKELHLRIENEPYMALVVEVIGGGEVSVAHYFEQNGDLVRDPEMVFSSSRDWQVVEFTVDSTGYHQRLPQGMMSRDFESFARTWAKNLLEQGFADKDVKRTSLTHKLTQ